MSDANINLRWARVAYGIDPQGDKKVVVRAERRGQRLVFSTLSLNAALLAEATRKRIPCSACLSARESLTRWLEVPAPVRRKAVKVLPTLLDIQLPFPLEDCAYCFLSASDRGRSGRSLAVVARQEEVQRKVESLRGLGIDPMVLDHEGLALWTRSLTEAPVGPGAEEGLRLLVSLRGEQSTLVIGRGTEFLTAHGIRPGDMGQIKRLLKQYQTPEAKQRESDTGLIPGKARFRWCWTGPGAVDVQAVADLHALWSREWPGPSFVHSEPGTFLARALAERALVAGPLRCNLRRGELTHPEIVERSGRQRTRTAALFLAAGLVLCGGNLAARMAVRQREAAADRAVGALADALAGSHVAAKGDAMIRIAGDTVHKKTEALRPFLNVFDPPLMTIVASVADAAKQDSLRLDTLSLSRDKIRMAGVARTWNGCDPMLIRLKRLGYSAKLDRKDAGASGGVPFSIASGGADEP